MSHTNDHSPHANGSDPSDADLAGLEAALDQLARYDASCAGDDFEARMASTTRFTLLASSNTRIARQGVDRGLHRIGWQKIAAVLALCAVGGVAWTLTRAVPDPLVALAPTPLAASTGDDSEVFSLVALALDDGNASEIDLLLRETAELDTTITNWAVPSDESSEGSSM